ncbi:MAG: universal stress protein [Acetobacteraceae bacterium]
MTETLRILVPTDGSEPSRRAVRHVLDLARRGLAVEIHMLNVQPAVRGVAASLVPQADLDAYHREEGMKALAESIQMVEAAGLTPHVHIGVGDPGETVVAFAHRLHCSQIVMGTRGLGAVGAALLGSVARHVVGDGTLPVTLLR